MKKGFTLIELLAVIVILAIIALIATPIILGIINDAREESNKRSVELYASAIRNAIATYQLTGTNAPTKFSDLKVEKEGNIECAIEELYTDGSFYIADCTVNGKLVDYTYGEKQELPSTQVYKPQYYYFGYDWSGRVGETAAPANPSTVPPTGKNHYLGYDVSSDNKVSVAYVCFVKNGTEYCLKGGTEGTAYETNKTVLDDAYKDVEGACLLSDDPDGTSYSCNPFGYIISSGTVFVDIDKIICVVENNSFSCFNNDI